MKTLELIVALSVLVGCWLVGCDAGSIMRRGLDQHTQAKVKDGMTLMVNGPQNADIVYAKGNGFSLGEDGMPTGEAGPLTEFWWSQNTGETSAAGVVSVQESQAQAFANFLAVAGQLAPMFTARPAPSADAADEGTR